MKLPEIFAAVDYRDHDFRRLALEVAQMADRSNIDGLVAGDHVTFGEKGMGNAALTTLAFFAGATRRVKLQSSVLLLALRGNPVPVARDCVTLDRLSDGRLILGVGIGGEDPNEWKACDIPLKTRARRTDEALLILRSLWTQERTTFAGRHFQLTNVAVEPKPVQKGGIPLWVGGRSDAALRRTARYGDGWMALWRDAKFIAEARDKINEWAADEGRDPRKIEAGLQVWCSVGENREKARRRLERRMREFYRTPFGKFSRYSPSGTAEQIAEFLAEHVEAGVTRFNLQLVQPNLAEVVPAAEEVKQELAKLVR